MQSKVVKFAKVTLDMDDNEFMVLYDMAMGKTVEDTRKMAKSTMRSRLLEIKETLEGGT